MNPGHSSSITCPKPLEEGVWGTVFMCADADAKRIYNQLHPMQKPWHEGRKPSPGLSVKTHVRCRAAAVTTMVPRHQASKNEKVVELKAKDAFPPHARILHEDLDWILTQPPTVMRLFLESWRSDSFGSCSSNGNLHWHELKTKLQGDNLKKAINVLAKAKLFQYDPIFEISSQGRHRIAGWKCWNMHGCYSSYWKTGSDNPDVPTENRDVPTENREEQPETQSQQAIQITQLLLKDLFKDFSNTLSQEERERFENFVREEWRKKTTKPGQPGEEIISLERFLAREEDCKNWYALFMKSPAGREAKKQAIAAKYDWRNDPRFEAWIWKAWNEGYPWAQEDEVEREERNAFLEWAQDTNAYEGVCY